MCLSLIRFMLQIYVNFAKNSKHGFSSFTSNKFTSTIIEKKIKGSQKRFSTY